MKVRILTILVLSMICLQCSDKSTDSGSGDNPPPIVTGFTISCTGDASTAVTQYISASVGGAITATGTDDVAYTLSIPAHSLASGATITLTPLTLFDVSGPVTIACLDTSAGSNLCYAGIVCEPSGLEFDSGAVLTIDFSAAPAFPFDSGATIACFDTALSMFYACSTLVDQANHRLSCQVNHFSGYSGTMIPPQDEEDECAALQAAYMPAHENAQAAAGSEYFYYAIARLFEMKAGNYRSDPYFTGQGWIPCPAFNNQVDNAIAQLVTTHWSEIQAQAPAEQVSGSVINDLIDHYRRFGYINAMAAGTSAGTTCENIWSAMRTFIDGRIRAWATIGYTMCQNMECNGRDILQGVLAYGDMGYVITAGYTVDDDYLAQVAGWINDCCNDDYSVTLSVPEATEIKYIALDVNDVTANPYNYACSVHVAVTGQSGMPMPDVPVRLFRVGEDHQISTMSTNDNGAAGFVIMPGSLDWLCQESINQEYYARVYLASIDDWSDPSNHVSVTYYNLEVTTTINYSCVYAWNPGDGYSTNFSATINGSGYGPARETGTCEAGCQGKLARNYDYELCFYDATEEGFVCTSQSTIGGDSVYACRASLDVRSVNVEGRSYEFLFSVDVSVGSALFAGLITVNDAGIIDTMQYGLGASVWPDSPLHMDFEYGSNIVDTTWGYQSEPGEIQGTKTASLHVLVSVQ